VAKRRKHVAKKENTWQKEENTWQKEENTWQKKKTRGKQENMLRSDDFRVPLIPSVLKRQNDNWPEIYLWMCYLDFL